MFTGIVEEVGKVREVSQGTLTVEAEQVLADTQVGDSISVDGACLTVVKLGRDFFSVNVVPETLAKTHLGSLHPGDLVNLERALTLAARIGGHLVQGHVEGLGTVANIAQQGEALVMDIQAPRELHRYIVRKGFVAVDGVSLTVVDCHSDNFRVSIIPFTLSHTNLGRRRVGQTVNLETDIIARYLESLLKEDKQDITWESLSEHGFLESPPR